MKTIILSFFFLLFAGLSISQTPAPVNSIRELTDSIAVIIKQEHITGLMLGIATKDSVLYSGGFGYADLEANRQVTENTLFRMGSITKMFVALGIMKLVKEGKLKLDDELKKIASEVPFQNKWETTNPVRIIHLLEHTSGFDDMKLNRLYAADAQENKGIEMMLVQKNSMICRWKPGERYAYSNPNYSILGYLIEKLSGKPYDQYLAENILNPLGMINSNFNVNSRFPQNDVKEYIVKNGRTIPVKQVTLLSGAQGALWSGAADMVKFLQFFLHNGNSIYPPGIINEIETTHSSLAAGNGQKNGYALANDNTFYAYAKYSYRGHDGLTGTCFSSFKYNRELGVGFVIASNCNNNNYRIGELIVNYLEQNLPGKKLLIQPINKKAIAPFLGRYQFESPRFIFSGFIDKLQSAPNIYFKNNKLYLKPLVGDPSELVQTAPMTFAMQGMNMPLIFFTKNDDGKNIMMIGGNYYEQTSNFWALLKRVIIIVAILFALSAILLGIISLIGAMMGKISRRDLIPAIIPMTGVWLLIWAILNLFEVQQYSYKLSELATVNFRTIVIFCGTTAFGIISVAGLLISIRSFRKPGRPWFRVYLLITAISLCLITAVLWQNGWIGLRTWAM
ncbi:MAG: beta-lactamase family protein [Ferruginibacter sp.]|nr:beta-lactamase family protein [Ferruginibacter sp.]